jgi:hypothetical protein
MSAATATRIDLVKPRLADEEDEDFRQCVEWRREDEIENFAHHLESARVLFRRHPELVQAEVFPEPYRQAIQAQYGYDPQNEVGVDYGDLHITDPAAASRKRSAIAREAIAARRESEREAALQMLSRASVSEMLQ